MELVSKKRVATSGDVRAIVNGSYRGDPHKLIREMASSLVLELTDELPALADRPIWSVALKVFERRLEDWLVHDDVSAPQGARPPALPVTMLSPADVVARQKLSALTTLYRYDKDGKVYCVMPRAKKNGRMFPAWQFVDPVPALLPQVIAELRGVMQFEIHAFFVTEQDELNELSPAEVLAGLPFETRHEIPPEQVRILSLPVAERLGRVLELAREAGQSMSD
ncbi:hypothetical protein [Paraburkholderia antibiotica]|uniref:Uncharacterized protein n=1 Tax=Paraburkholderia antibiotica TaxID=2728839 RepID=A0A7Y0A2R8_9BURK|nr:hypothetical protein [Paraburkholderia antibiotica]NML35368.1 hypothetical protein [Paraburkholderia antibiotica]